MSAHELQNELDEIVETMANDLAKTIQEMFPALTDEDAVSSARLRIGLSIALPGADEKKAATVHNGAVAVVREAGFEWADRYNAAFITKFRPTYDSAIEAGVDPAQVIAAVDKMTVPEARVIVRTFKKMDKAAATSTPADDNPAPVTPSVNDEDDNGYPKAEDEQSDPFAHNSHEKVTADA